VPGDTEWSRVWLVLTTGLTAASVKSRRRTSFLAFLPGSNSPLATRTDDEMGTASFFASKRAKKPFLQLRDIWYSAAAYPEHAKLVDKTAIFRCDGTSIWDNSAEMPSGVQGSKIQVGNKAFVERDGGRGASQHSVLLMPDPSTRDPQHTMLMCITAFADAFGVSFFLTDPVTGLRRLGN
jgi:CCR4-NOT transcriptional complex subunit CAF120